MINRKDSLEIRYNDSMKSEAGPAKITNFMTAEEAEGHGRLFAKVEIPAGSGIAYHPHNGEFEAYYIIEGEGIINDNGEETTISAGDFHKCPSGNSHSIVNKGDKPLVMIALIMSSEK